MTTPLFRAMRQAAAFEADALSLEKLTALGAAEKAYCAAVRKAQAAWDALPEGAAKDSAEVNANDTAIEQAVNAADQLYRLEMAVASYEING